MEERKREKGLGMAVAPQQFLADRTYTWLLVRCCRLSVCPSVRLSLYDDAYCGAYKIGADIQLQSFKQKQHDVCGSAAPKTAISGLQR